MTNQSDQRTVEKVIKHAILHGDTDLDLKFLNLTELPESVRDLTHIESLDVSDNSLTSLPDWIGELRELNSLFAFRNEIRLLPKQIGLLEKLENLYLARNQIESIPASIGQLKNLRGLYLSDNRLSGLPESLGNLRQLKDLYLSYNTIPSIPPFLLHLSSLEDLSIEETKLRSLPHNLSSLESLQRLRCGSNYIERLPDSICDLANLQLLDIEHNRLTALPESFQKLSNLEMLDISKIHFPSPPIQIGQLENLHSLFLSDNDLYELPTWILNLTSLTILDVSFNYLTTIPDWLPTLKNLIHLNLSYNPLKEIPVLVGSMTSLTDLNLSNCQLKDLPTSLAELKLTDLNLDKNPLAPDLAAAYLEGPDDVRAYLSERAKGLQHRFEAKLLILGDGNEGKTCVSRALRGLPFTDQPTTRGVDVEPWSFPHPAIQTENDCELTLHIWDFEGQEINHQTHQFFLAPDSLYVLVFKSRDLFLLDRAEYWLDTIRSRAPGARVAIVISECEERMPYVPQDRLQEKYGDLLGTDRWLFGIGCANMKGVKHLRSVLQQRAARLDHIGRAWPKTYNQAEEKVRALSKTRTHITRHELYNVFKNSSINSNGYAEAARFLACLGAITEFPECPDLRDFIVLQPQWLTKAISHVLESEILSEAKGEITFTQMEEIWVNQLGSSMFAVFHNCMKEFELCYDLETQTDRCLIPLRFGFKHPVIPWSTAERFKTRRVSYKLDMRAPAGLMSRFIVKTHHIMARTVEHIEGADKRSGVYWHNGVFLQSGEGDLLSQALCRFDPESRTLNVEVRAAFPQKMLDQVDAFVRAVFGFYRGLKTERSYGCIRVDEASQQESQCAALHPESTILFALESGQSLQCGPGRHYIAPIQLIMGVRNVGESVEAIIREECERTRTKMDHAPMWAKPLISNMETLIGWADRNEKLLRNLTDRNDEILPSLQQELQLKLREYLGHISDMLDERQQKSAPSIYSISERSGKSWNPNSYIQQTYILTPWCECDGKMHKHDEGAIAFTTNREWWNRATPWIGFATRILATGLQLALTGLPLTLREDTYGSIKDDISFMKELSKHVELRNNSGLNESSDALRSINRESGDHIKSVVGTSKESAILRASLVSLLETIAPMQYRAGQWGELRRIQLPDNSYRWMCDQHAREMRR